MLAMDGLSEQNFDVVPSPGRRMNTQYVSGPQAQRAALDKQAAAVVP